jgi:hypothetical protein
VRAFGGRPVALLLLHCCTNDVVFTAVVITAPVHSRITAIPAAAPKEIPLRVNDDMTVEVALAVMTGARVEYLTVCDGDDESTGSVSLVRLADLRESAAYTDRIRLRDVLDGGVLAPSH